MSVIRPPYKCTSEISGSIRSYRRHDRLADNSAETPTNAVGLFAANGERTASVRVSHTAGATRRNYNAHLGWSTSARSTLASIGPSAERAPHGPRRAERQHALLILKYRMIDERPAQTTAGDAGTYVTLSVVAFVVNSTTTSSPSRDSWPRCNVAVTWNPTLWRSAAKDEVLGKCQTPLHGHRLRTPATDELATIIQLVVQQSHH